MNLIYIYHKSISFIVCIDVKHFLKKCFVVCIRLYSVQNNKGVLDNSRVTAKYIFIRFVECVY